MPSPQTCSLAIWASRESGSLGTGLAKTSLHGSVDAELGIESWQTRRFRNLGSDVRQA